MRYLFEKVIDKERWYEGSMSIPTEWLNDEIRGSMMDQLGIVPDVAYVSDAAGDYSFIKVVIGGDLYVHKGNYDIHAGIRDYKAIFGKDPFSGE